MIRGAAPAAAAVALAGLMALGAAAPTVAQRSPLERGLEALRTGEYEAAVRLLDGAARSGGEADRVVAVRAASRARAMTGDYEAALAALDRAARSLPAAELATARGRVLVKMGRDAEALAAFDEAIAADAGDAVSARADRGELLWRRGGRAAAYRTFEELVDLYNRGRAGTAAELTAVGTAARYLGRRDPAWFHDAVRVYDAALAADPLAHEPRLRMAALFLDKYDGGEARTLYGEVLAANPRHPAALRGMARAKRFEGSSEALELAERAVSVNPSADGRALLALLRLELGDDDEAVAEADRALAANPRQREALAVRAAARYLADDSAAFASDRDRALEADPTFAGFYVTVAELAVRRGRYHGAVELAAAAVAVDSTAWDARALLGMNLLRLGRIEDARAALERAFAGDPFNVWTKNTLDLMDRLAGFTTVRTDRFELVLDPAEAELLAPYLADAAEAAFDALADRYGFEPETPVRVEVYPRHSDFSVRTMGLTGLGALGVAFGNVLAMDSPAARDPGAFHWGSTLWHEIAHAFTLGMTRHRIPRWLTEGISVREERRSRPGWSAPISFAFFQAFHQDLLLPMARLDAGFVRPSYPGQVGVSYQHASVVVALIEDRHGGDAIRRMLDAYRDGADTETVFRDVLGVTLDDFDDRFHAYVRERFPDAVAAAASLADAGMVDGHPGAVSSGGPGSPGGGADVATLVRRAAEGPDAFGAQMAAGTALFDADRFDEAAPFLERALALYPEYIGPGSPYALLAAIRRERGDAAGAASLLERLTSLDESALGANRALAELLESRGDPAGAADALARAAFIYPYDAGVHGRLAELAAEMGRPALEVRARRAMVALRPVDRAGALYRLAVAERRAGDTAAARRSVLAALEIAPAYAEAQDLLLELVGGGGP